MNHPEHGPLQRDLEDVLRQELLMVAESVEPGRDGLNRIRSRIRAQRPARSAWIMTGSAGSAVPGGFSIRNLGPVHRAAHAFVHSGAHRFGLGDQGMGWHRWLRPMAALATGVFVVLAGSWAVTALPQIIASTSSSFPPGASAGGVPVGSSSGSTTPRTGSQHDVTGPGHSNPGAYPQRRHGR